MDHANRIEEELSKQAALFLNRESNRISLITVMRTILSADGKRAQVMVSVFPEEKEDTALNFLKRKRTDFREHLKHSAKLSRIPTIDFIIDRGEKNRQRVEELSDLQ